MSFITYSDEQARFAYAPEAAWGTAITADASFKELLVPKGVKINPAVNKLDLDQNRASRIQNLADVFVDNYSGPVEITIPELIVTRDRAADFLFAVLQNRVSQGEAGAFQKVFTHSASQPDFTVNAGYFFSLAWYSPIVAKSMRITSCIVKSLTIDFDKSGADGVSRLVKFSNVTILGKKLTTGVTITPSAWAAQGTERYLSDGFTYTDVTGGGALPWLRCSVSLDNGARPQDFDADGTSKTFFLDPPKMGAASVSVTHWYNAATTGTTRDFLAAHIAGTIVNSKISYGTTGVVGFFDVNFYGILNENPQADENRQIMVPATWICGDSGANKAITITIADGISQ